MTVYLLIGLAAFGAGFVNAMAGGGTLLSFPALLYTGMGSIAANATSTVALWPGSVTSAWAYRQRLAAQRRLAWTLAVPSVLGGLLGAWLLLSTPERFFRWIVPYLILLACALLTLQEPISRWLTRRLAAHPRTHLAALWMTQLAIAVYGGYFGAGIGILMLAGMAIFLPEDLQAANGLKNLLATIINGTAVVYFLVAGAAVLQVAAPLAVAAILGGYVGAHAAQRLSPRWLRVAVVSYGVVVAVHLLLNG